MPTAPLARATGTDTIGEGIVLGLVVGIGFAAAILLNTAAFEFAKPNRWAWGAIDATYHAVGFASCSGDPDWCSDSRPRRGRSSTCV